MTNSKIVKSVIIIFASILSLVSCIETNNYVGSNLIPSDQDITINTVEFDLPIEMKMADSLQAGSFSILLGSISSETFGRVDVGSAITMVPQADTIDWGDNPIFKSMKLQILVSDKTTLSDDQKYIPQNIRVYPLTSYMDTTYIYTNSVTENDYDVNDLLCETVYSGQDSIIISLPERWGSKLFDVTQEELDSTLLFIQKYYGLYFACDPVEDGIYGGRINHLDYETASATLTYSSINYQGIRRDTTEIFDFGTYKVVNTIKSSSEKYAGMSTDDQIFIEGYNGIKPYINGLKLYNMIKDWADSEGIDLSHMIVARASFDFPFEANDDYSNLKVFPNAIYPCTRVEGTYYTSYTPIDGTSNTSINIGKMNRSFMSYRPDAASYFQTLVKSDIEDIDQSYDLWFMPLYEYVTESSSSTSDYYNNYYNNYYNSYYNPYGYGYSGYGGYGGYGYGGYGYGYGGYGYGYDSYGYGNYYNNYYNYYNYYGYGNSSSSSSSTYYLDTEDYSCGVLNGTKCERHPKLKITYSTLK